MSHWRDTYRSPRFLILDARAAIPVGVCLLHVAWYTVIPALCILAAFFWLERIGLDFASALRAFRSALAGRHRPALVSAKLHKPIDYDRRPRP